MSRWTLQLQPAPRWMWWVIMSGGVLMVALSLGQYLLFPEMRDKPTVDGSIYEWVFQLFMGTLLIAVFGSMRRRQELEGRIARLEQALAEMKGTQPAGAAAEPGGPAPNHGN